MSDKNQKPPVKNYTLEDLKATGPAHMIVDWPTSGLDPLDGDDVPQVAIILLSHAQIITAKKNAEEVFREKKIEISVTTMDALRMENNIQILWFALREVGDLKRTVCLDQNRLRKLLTHNEINYFVDKYNELDQKHNPNFDEMDSDEFNEFVDEVKKKPEQTISNFSDINLQIKFL